MATRTRETFLWDTITHSDPVAAGAEFRYFINTTSKGRHQQNFDDERRIPEGSEMRIHGIRCAFPDAGAPPADVTLILQSCWVQVLVDEVSQFEAPMWALPAGGGIHFVTPEAAATTDNIQNGIPSAAAVHRRAHPIIVTGKQSYEVILRYGAAADMSGDVVVQVALDVETEEVIRA